MAGPSRLVVLVVLLACSPAAAGSRPAWQGQRFVVFLGGPSLGSGRLKAFTQETAASPARRASRPFGAGDSQGLRAGVWMPGSWFGIAFDASRLHLTARGGGLEAYAIGFLALFRPPPGAGSEPRLFPYLGIGPSTYFSHAWTDFRPEVAAAVSSWQRKEHWLLGPWTFDARLGGQWRFWRDAFFLAETRMTRFAFKKEWTPSTWFGPPARYREGIEAEAFAVSLQAGVGLEF